jgi:hypothetical protein
MNDKLQYHDSMVMGHINDVRQNIWTLIKELDQRAQIHDASKLQSPEREIYSETAHELKDTVYGSPEYKNLMERTKPAIEHHYANNRHHPEHFTDGINEMDLIDVMELLCDWIAATKKNKNGNIHKSIEINTPRFNMSPQLAQILTNTVDRYF